MMGYEGHIINKNQLARLALKYLDQLPVNISKTLFVVDNDQKLIGTLTDGDIRRGLINEYEISEPVEKFMNLGFRYLNEENLNVELIKSFRQIGIKQIPVVNDEFQIIQILDLNKVKTVLPITVVIMAGGRGERLKPFTDIIPKPLLKVGEKPILEHNIDRLISFGITEIFVSVKYLKEQIMEYFGDGTLKGISIRYIEESEPLGTLGSLSLIDNIKYDDILIMNSDLLTNIDFEDFYNFYKQTNATMALASIPYHVKVPYAVLETDEHKVSAFKEKPTYTFYSNGGIYLLQSGLKALLEKGIYFDATDMMEKVLTDSEYNLIHYPLLGYWLDIGNHADYNKAQEDIKHLNL
jgi:dTDP-glucose pyrophosphorylase